MLGTLNLSQPWWLLLVAYVVGATPFGFLAGKMKGIDIRDHGSGNIGATNVLRILGKPIGIGVLVLDVCKGMFPVIASMLITDFSPIHIFTALAAIFGHNYTFWLKFKGGKGIATTAGAIAPLITISLVLAVLTWLVMLKTTRYVSIASIAAALSLPITLAIINSINDSWDWPVFIFTSFVGLLAVWKHRVNVVRLYRGEEHRFERKAKSTAPPSEA